MKFTLLPVTATDHRLQTVLTNLTKFYCYEWSPYLQMDVDDKGEYLFERYLPLYWQKPDRKAFLLQCERDTDSRVWAGFALIDRDFMIHPDYDYSLAEFFVLSVHRRNGAGKLMAETLFDRFPGRWELGRNPKNLSSVPFWDRVIDDYTGGHFEVTYACPAHRYPDGTLGDVFAFESRNIGNK